MAYRSLRKFKQQQREYEFLQDRAADESFGEYEAATDAEIEDQASDAYYERLDAARRYALPIRSVTLGDEMGVGR
jgi:hypothetical protein